MSWFPHKSSSYTCSGRELLRISGMGYYGRNGLAAIHPPVPKHRRECKALTLTSGLASSFLYPQPTADGRGVAAFMLAL